MGVVNFSLLEILEAPRRITNVSYDKVIDYMFESIESEERFKLYLEVLRMYCPGAYLGFALYASDMIPLKNLFSEEIKEAKTPIHDFGSVSLFNVIDMLHNYFKKCLFTEEKHRKFLFRYAAQSLSMNDYNLFLFIIKQEKQEKLFSAYKNLFENNELPTLFNDYFSFYYEHNEEQVKFTPNCFGTSSKTYWLTKVGSMFFVNNKKYLNSRESAKLMTEFTGITMPFVSKLLFDEDKLVGVAAGSNILYAFKNHSAKTEEEIIDLVTKSFKLYCVVDSKVVSVYPCTSTITVKVDSIEYFNIENIINSEKKKIAIIKSGDDKYVVNTSVEINSKELKLVKIHNSYFLRGE